MSDLNRQRARNAASQHKTDRQTGRDKDREQRKEKENLTRKILPQKREKFNQTVLYKKQWVYR